MSNRESSLLLAAAVEGGAASKPVTESAAIDEAFDTLKSYDLGSGRAALLPIDDVIRAAIKEAPARKELERRLVGLLSAQVSREAKEYACRKLALLGAAESVPALARLLPDKDLAQAARSALESMPCPEAVRALRESLSKLSDLEQVGVINSLGARRDTQSVRALTKLLTHADHRVAGAAAAALGDIASVEAARALRKFEPRADETYRATAANASLVCAERLLADGKKAEAAATYRALDNPRQPKHVRLAAQRGLKTASGQN